MDKIKLNSADMTVSYRNEKIKLTPPPVRHIRAERHESLPLYDEKCAGWKRGCRLLAVQANECSFTKSIVPGSVKVKMNGQWMKAGIDFLVDEYWGTVSRTAESQIIHGEQIAVSYSFYPSRIDTLYLKKDGSIALKIGKEGMAHPEIPAVSQKEVRLANIYWHRDSSEFTEEQIYPVVETEFPADMFCVRNRPDKTLHKLRSGEKVRILAWGDSVTECAYLPEKFRWQEQFCRRLRKKYPAAQIELLTEAWGGRSTSSYLAVPPGEAHNFEETVLAVKPDLIISEFVNDCGIKEEVFRENYRKIKDAFDKIGAEWIIQTPHYTHPDWMPLTKTKGCDDDPRAFVKFLREFAGANKIPLADASLYWGRLYRQGIPYETLFSNGINHPLEYGLSLFADALMKLF